MPALRLRVQRKEGGIVMHGYLEYAPKKPKKPKFWKRFWGFWKKVGLTIIGMTVALWTLFWVLGVITLPVVYFIGLFV